MKDNKGFYCFIAIGIFLLIILGIFYSSEKHEDEVWNNGHCSCGGNWEYEQAVGHYSSTTYMYICDKCGKRYEFNDIRSNN